MSTLGIVSKGRHLIQDHRTNFLQTHDFEMDSFDHEPLDRKDSRGECIHSGHFMISEIDESVEPGGKETLHTQDDYDQKDMVANDVSGQALDFEGKEVKEEYVFGDATHQKTVAIDASLSKLLQCMSIAYSCKLTSPKWKQFKGLRLKVKDKIRLNNIIWRCWHMQYIHGKKPPVCQFATTTDVHNKPEAVLLEGKYWKRGTGTVTAEYNKWRKYHKEKHSSNVSEIGSEKSFSPNDFRTFSTSSMQDYNFEDDFMSFGDNTLFSLLTPNSSFGFPSSRELNRSGFGPDCIQPSLSQLQPPIDMEFDDFFTPKFNILPTLQEEPQAECPDMTMSTSGKNYSLAQQNPSLASRPMACQPPMDLANQDVPMSSQVNPSSSFRYSYNSGADMASSASSMDYQVMPHGKKTATATSNSSGNNSLVMSTNNNNNHNHTQHMHNQVRGGETLSYVANSCVSTTVATSAYSLQQQVSTDSGTSADMYSMSTLMSTNSAENVKLSMPYLPQHQQQVTSSGYFASHGLHGKLTHSSSRMSPSSSQGHLFSPPLNTNVPRKSLRVPFERSSSLPLYHSKQQQSLDSYSSSSAMKSGGQQHSNTSQSIVAQLLLTPNNHQHLSHQNSMNSFPQQQIALQTAYPHNQSQGSSSRNTYGSPSSFGSFLPNNPSSPILDSGINTLSPSSTLSSPQSLDSPTSPAIHPISRNRHHSVRFADDSQAFASTESLKKSTPVRKISSPARICSNHPSALASPFKEPQSPVMSPSSYSHQRMSPKSSSGKKAMFGLTSSSPVPLHHHVVGAQSSPTHEHHDKTQYKEHRRVCHINAEQKRRCNIKNGFDTLRQILPSVSQNTNTKISKAAMLAKAAEHIRQLKQDRHNKMEECELYRGEIETFNHSISMYQSQLPATGAPVPVQRTGHVKEMFAEYVRRKTQENWKFYIFSTIMEPMLESYDSSTSTTSVNELCKSTMRWLDNSCSLVTLRRDVLNSLRHLSMHTSILTNPAAFPEEALRAVSHTETQNNE